LLFLNFDALQLREPNPNGMSFGSYRVNTVRY